MELNLDSFGARLRIKDGIYEVIVPDMSGNNHHVTQQFAAHEAPVITLQPGTSLSTDAALYALENDTDIVFLDSLGNPAGRLLPAKPSSTLNIWHNQLAISSTPLALQVARSWILLKFQYKFDLLRKLKPYRSGHKLALIEKAEKEMRALYNSLTELTINEKPDKVPDLIRGYEGTAGRVYWRLLGDLIPPEYRFEQRSRRPALDLFNTFLNYAYGILYRHVEKALLLAGVHPYIGFLHADDYQRKSMVFDFMEPYRVWVDNCIFKLFSAKEPLRSHIDERKDGGFWLNKMGKRLVADTFTTRFVSKEYPYDDNKWYSLGHIMRMDARRVASWLNGNGANIAKLRLSPIFEPSRLIAEAS
jgi:CRISP-associated protein Cas1